MKLAKPHFTMLVIIRSSGLWSVCYNFRDYKSICHTVKSQAITWWIFLATEMPIVSILFHHFKDWSKYKNRSIGTTSWSPGFFFVVSMDAITYNEKENEVNIFLDTIYVVERRNDRQRKKEKLLGKISCRNLGGPLFVCGASTQFFSFSVLHLEIRTTKLLQKSEKEGFHKTKKKTETINIDKATKWWNVKGTNGFYDVS